MPVRIVTSVPNIEPVQPTEDGDHPLCAATRGRRAAWFFARLAWLVLGSTGCGREFFSAAPSYRLDSLSIRPLPSREEVSINASRAPRD
jgi:hypothetical protein